MLRSNGSIVVSELSSLFNVSEGTIRRDLRGLQKEGLLKKTYGGAVTAGGVSFDTPFNVSKDHFVEEKQRLARAAADLVKEGETIFVEAGTTTLHLARLLRQKHNLMVVTNGIHIASELCNSEGTHVFLIGGDLRQHTAALVGPHAERCLEEIRVDKAFLGISGVVTKRGMTTGTLAEAQIKRGIINCAKEVIAVTDHSKFDRELFAFVAPLTAVHKIIVDDGISNEDLQAMKEMGLEVIIVSRL